MHTHELFLRSKSESGITLQPFSRQSLSATEPTELLMQSCDSLVKAFPADGPSDAVLYKIDGKCEYMISREFFLWPNDTDTQKRFQHNEARKNSRRQRKE